jgi:hypothetical protein
MNYKPVKAVMLRNNDKFIDVDGSVSERWTAMNRLVNKVTS